MGFKKTVLNIAFFSLISLSLAACGSFDFFKKSAEPSMETTDPQQEKTPQMESTLSIVKQEQVDLKTQIKEKDIIIQRLENKIKKLTKKIDRFEKAQLSAKQINYKIVYTTPADLYKKARNLLLEEDYITAAIVFEKFIAAHPKDSLADNAVYWLGECHYSMQDFKKAILVFKKLEQQYPKSEKVPDAILKTGYSYISLDDTNRANHFLKKVLKKYPFSPAAEKAQKKLENFK